MNWGSTAALGTISLATVSNGLPKEDVDRLRQQITQAADKYLKVIKGEGYSVAVSGANLTWGSNSDVLNNALIMALAYDFTQSAAYLDGVTESMSYLLGRNANNQSFVSGYGTTSLSHPHHRVWGNQPDAGFPPPPPGAIAGGANAQPSDPIAISKVNSLPPARRYLDNIESYSTNEVCINWNAPLVWVTGYLDEQVSK
jgi:endoglucanase